MKINDTLKGSDDSKDQNSETPDPEVKPKQNKNKNHETDFSSKELLSSNSQIIGKIEETSDTLKDSDDSKDQTNEDKAPEADEDETPKTGMI
mgnify:CR=1 FL=1